MNNAKKSGSSACAFTIVSKNYLHFARTLMKSIQLHASDLDRIVCLCDTLDDLSAENEPFDLINIDELPITDLDEFVFQYTILELNTAIKPFVFESLFKKYGYEKVIYFDPDIRIYNHLDEMVNLLDNYQVILTPHLIDRLDDGRHPGELEILQSGTYNLGYIGLRQTRETEKLLSWWQSKMKRDCVVDVPRGLFVDQKWMDMVPGMYENVYINRNPGWNVAYWNLNHRKIKKVDDKYFVNEKPLVFFHFSGISLDGKVFSKHQDRFTMQSVGKHVRDLALTYVKELIRNGGDESAKLRYGFGYFPDGTSIPDMGRAIFREERDQFGQRLNASMVDGGSALIEYLNEPASSIGRTSPYISRLAYRLYLIRRDLQLAFPDIFGVDGVRYADWFVHNAKEQAGIDDVFIDAVRRRLKHADNERQVTEQQGEVMVPQAPSENVIRRQRFVLFSRFLYEFAWRNRKYFRRFVKYDTRHKLHAWLIRSAFNSPEVGSNQITMPLKKPSTQLPGINLIGYLHAESGVGQSARSTIRAAVAGGVDIALIDFRTGNVSRMQEDLDIPITNQQKFIINLFHINADQVPIVRNKLGESFFSNRYNIGYWAWELPQFPEKWQDSLEPMDEIWVPSFFCQEAISSRANIPVLRIPHCVDMVVPSTIGRSALGLPEKGFIFCFIFDVLSVTKRKNPLAVLEAFQRAFGGNYPGVYMLLKLSNIEHDPDLAGEIRRLVDNKPSIIVINEYLKRDEVNALINEIDCYISLHRSEGFGLTIAEAMFLAKPVIATGWSGNMDYMRPWNSMPVSYELVEIEKDLGPYHKGSVWAEPDIDHAAQCMREVFTNQGLRDRIGAMAQQTISEQFSPAVIGAKIKERTERIWQGK